MTQMENVVRNAESITLRVFEKLSSAIIRGELPPGAKLSEPALARKYRTSRGPIREAIQKLSERKLVICQARRGARVIELSPGMIAEIFTVREALEGIAAREAAKHITNDEIAALRRMLKTQRGVTNSYESDGEFGEEDFHLAVAKCSHNAAVIDLLCGGYYQLLQLHRARLKPTIGHRTEQGFAEHTHIVDALESRDPELAEFLMRRHIARTYKKAESIEAVAGAGGSGGPPPKG
jgi:DNA-binding GntR family transcriptional regulator